MDGMTRAEADRHWARHFHAKAEKLEAQVATLRTALERIEARLGPHLPGDEVLDDALGIATAALAETVHEEAEASRVRAALWAFIHAYANTGRLDRDRTEVALFEAWLKGCAALGIAEPDRSER